PKLVRWTFSEVGGLDTTQFVVPQLIHYPTFDGLTIPAFYYKPKKKPTDPPNKKFPVMIRIHGGPESQFRPEFLAMIQYYAVECGIAQLAPNVRGSSGYGKKYLEMDNGMKREDSVKDIGKLIEWVHTQDDLDATRVVVNGGSYGGYM